MSVYEVLSAVDVSKQTKKKDKLTYLSWPFAWGELLKRYPTATYKVYENKDGWNYHTDGKTAWVKTGVTVEGVEHVEMLPVMDYRNKAIGVDQITSTDVNKAIQRSLTKAIARHGLGLYIYAGEDLPGGAPAPGGGDRITEKQVKILENNAKYVYKNDWALMLATFLSEIGVDRLEDLNLKQMKEINRMMDKDRRVEEVQIK